MKPGDIVHPMVRKCPVWDGTTWEKRCIVELSKRVVCLVVDSKVERNKSWVKIVTKDNVIGWIRGEQLTTVISFQEPC